MTTDQPTPASSLEEAAQRHVRGLFDGLARTTEEWDRARLDFMAGAEWSRAEVIREVEAALLADRGVIGSDMEFLDVRPVLGLLARLRALSQGGGA